jgi:hypothetical protein
MFAQRHPEMPLLKRYKPNVRYWGETHGDMAAMSGNETLREKRNILFQTDSFGFRNKCSSHGAKYNLIILGDSFAVGNGTTQDGTWPSLLSSKYNLTIYNLSMAGGPWQHYINLKLEYRRLKVQPGTIILLTVFTGNDLDNYYCSTSNVIELSKIGLLEHWKTAIDNFRNRSPMARVLRQVLIQLDADKYADKVVTRKFLNTRSMAFFRPYVQRKDRCKDDIISHPNYLLLNNVLSNLKDFCEKNSLQLNIMLMPSKAEVYEWLVDRMPPWSTSTHPSGFSSILQAFCEKNGIEFLDLKPFLINESRRIWNRTKACLWWYDDTHMNPAGHQAVAAAVYDQLLVPIRKKS